MHIIYSNGVFRYPFCISASQQQYLLTELIDNTDKWIIKVFIFEQGVWVREWCLWAKNVRSKNEILARVRSKSNPRQVMYFSTARNEFLMFNEGRLGSSTQTWDHMSSDPHATSRFQMSEDLPPQQMGETVSTRDEGVLYIAIFLSSPQFCHPEKFGIPRNGLDR